jgi:hypothetical protein
MPEILGQGARSRTDVLEYPLPTPSAPDRVHLGLSGVHANEGSAAALVCGRVSAMHGTYACWRSGCNQSLPGQAHVG